MDEKSSVLEQSVSLTKPPVPWQFKEYQHITQAWDAGWYAGVSRAIAVIRSVRCNAPDPTMYQDAADSVYQAEARMHGDMAGYEAYMASRRTGKTED